MKSILSILFISGLFIFSCKKEKAEEPVIIPVVTTVSFASDVLPIFIQSCGTGNNCHGDPSAADGKIYETYAGAIAVPDATTLGSIKHEPGFSPMPRRFPQLTAEQVGTIEAWINGGKKND